MAWDRQKSWTCIEQVTRTPYTEDRLLCFPFYADLVIIVGRTEMEIRPNSDGGIPEEIIDSFAQDILRRMSPLQRGKLLYPHARPVAVKDLPQCNFIANVYLYDKTCFVNLPGDSSRGVSNCESVYIMYAL